MIKILVYVQHLLGIGHLQRTALITSALAENGLDVTVISGGVPEPLVNFGKVTLVQMPGVKADSGFTNLFDENGDPVTDEIKQRRVDCLVKTLNDCSPDFVLIETYPFGRRQMRFELLPFLAAIRIRPGLQPVVACSIRDVIQPKSRPKRIQEICELVDQYFDYVFVHGDENFLRLESSFPTIKSFRQKVVYTGYITKSILDGGNPTRSKNSILVSAGGGAVGEKLYQAAIDASRHAKGKAYNWHVLIGNNLPGPEFNRHMDSRSENLEIEPNREDFLQLLSGCMMSVSQGGYNTLMDILITGTPAIVVPFKGQSEQEQLIRSRAFEKMKRLVVLCEKDLNPLSLLYAIENNKSSYQCQLSTLRMDGANWLAGFIKKVVHKKQ